MRSLMETNPQLLLDNISQHLLTERTSQEGSEVRIPDKSETSTNYRRENGIEIEGEDNAAFPLPKNDNFLTI